MKVHVGVPEIHGKVAKFPFSLLELNVKPSMLGAKGLKSIATERPDLAFALRAPSDYPLLPEATSLALFADPLKAIRPEAIVLPTGPRFGPTKENQRLLSEVVKACQSVARFVAWEPHGVFEVAEAARWAEDAGAVYVSDWSREAALTGPIGYTRLRALGRSGGISQNQLERILELLPDFGEAFIVVEGEGALRFKNALAAALEEEGLLGGGEDEDGDEEDFEDDEEDLDSEDDEEDD
jgi:hypothetical protein